MTETTLMSTLLLSAPLEPADILRILPHRPPFLFVDRVTHLTAGGSIIGVKTVDPSEPWFAGHFPGEPVFPGVLLLEAMAQVGGVLAAATGAPVTKDSLPIAPVAQTAVASPRFLSADKVKFRRVVVPGDVIELRADLLQRRAKVFRLQAQARVGGMIAAEAEILIGSVTP